MANFFFCLGFVLLLLHEMDAIRCKEWRILPLTFFLDEGAGYLVFMGLHIPVYLWLMYGLMGAQQAAYIIGLSYFFLIHLGLHLLYLMHPRNEFKDWISWAIITGVGICGALVLYHY